MVEAPLVIPDVAFGRTILQTLDEAGFPTSVAMWLKEDDKWNLVLGTPLYEELGPKDAYLRLIKALSREGPVAVSSLPLRLQGHSNSLIKGLRKRFGKTASVQGMRLGGHTVGGEWIEDAYVYRIK